MVCLDYPLAENKLWALRRIQRNKNHVAQNHNSTPVKKTRTLRGIALDVKSSDVGKRVRRSESQDCGENIYALHSVYSVGI